LFQTIYTKLCLASFKLILGSLLLYTYTASASEGALKLSSQVIKRDITYNGTSVSVEGAIPNNFKLILVVLGPAQSFSIKKKESLYGLWIDSRGFSLPLAYSFYRIYSNLPFQDYDENFYQTNLPISPEKATCSLIKSFHQESRYSICRAFIDYQISKNLYRGFTDILGISSDGEFKISVDLPKNAPQGIYQVIPFLVDLDSTIYRDKSLFFEVRNVGLYNKIIKMHREDPYTYSVTAVVFALVTG
jgi:hypothetical protein